MKKNHEKRGKKIIWKLCRLAKYTGENKRKGLSTFILLSLKEADDRHLNVMLLLHPCSLRRLVHTFLVWTDNK